MKATLIVTTILAITAQATPTNSDTSQPATTATAKAGPQAVTHDRFEEAQTWWSADDGEFHVTTGANAVITVNGVVKATVDGKTHEFTGYDTFCPDESAEIHVTGGYISIAFLKGVGRVEFPNGAVVETLGNCRIELDEKEEAVELKGNGQFKVNSLKLIEVGNRSKVYASHCGTVLGSGTCELFVDHCHTVEVKWGAKLFAESCDSIKAASDSTLTVSNCKTVETDDSCTLTTR